MVHRCCISSCGMNVRVPEAKGLSYHGFPNKEPLREQWMQAIIPHLDKPESFRLVPKYTRVCSRHFRKKDYSVDIKKRARLNSNAVPSVFPRKNSPIVIPNVLSSPNRATTTVKGNKTGEPSILSDLIPTTSRASGGEELCTPTTSTSLLDSSLLLPVSWQLGLAEDGLANSSNANHHLHSSSGGGENREFVIESATLSEDQLTLRVRDASLEHGGGGGISSSSISQEDISQSSSITNYTIQHHNHHLTNDDSNEETPHKKRKRRKWNRSAFDRPAKGKKKGSEEDVDDNIDGVGEALAEISLSTLLAITTPNLKLGESSSGGGSINNFITHHHTTQVPDSHPSTSTSTSASTPTTPSSFKTVTISLGRGPDQVSHLSIEQELLQSIQAVSLHCGEGDISAAPNTTITNSTSTTPRPPPFLHHSSEESIFSTTEEENPSDTTTTSFYVSSLDTNVNLEYPSVDGVEEDPVSAARSNSPTLLSQLVNDIGLVDDDRDGPTLLEIEHLANHFNTSLLTGYNNSHINLSIGLEDLHLLSSSTTTTATTTTTTDHHDNNNDLGSTTASSSEDDVVDRLLFTATDVSNFGNGRDTHHHIFSIPISSSSSSSLSMIKLPPPPPPPRPRPNYPSTSSSGSGPRKKKKAPDSVRLTGVTKKHKKEKICGQFSVERFSNSDKDIEYYTGFSSYRTFEAFFRSLEAYVERLRVTDVMFGVANLDKLHSAETSDASLDYSSDNSSEFILPQPPPPGLDEQPIKRRPFHGRSMSRIDELFMTIIRLRRKLPEKVLGHMFCISQPTVSRIIRAWTVLLSKLIDCYPIEGSSSSGEGGSGGTNKSNNKSNNSSNTKQSNIANNPLTSTPACFSNKPSEHSYTSRGLGIPESFRQLFHSELAQSIVVTSVSAKDKKTAQTTTKSTPTPPPCSSSKRSKKSRVEEVPIILEPEKTTNNLNLSPPSTEQQVCDLLVDGVEGNLLFGADLETEECDLFTPFNL